MMTLKQHKALAAESNSSMARADIGMLSWKAYPDAVAALENLATKAREVLMMPENSTLRENAEDECWQALKELGVKP